MRRPLVRFAECAMLDVRCFTCNNLIGDMWPRYMETRYHRGGKAALDELGLKRMCCRRMLLAHVPVIDDIIVYPNHDVTLDECGTTLHREVKQVRVVGCD